MTLYNDPYWQKHEPLEQKWLVLSLSYYVLLFIIGTCANSFVVYYYLSK